MPVVAEVVAYSVVAEQTETAAAEEAAMLGARRRAAPLRARLEMAGMLPVFPAVSKPRAVRWDKVAAVRLVLSFINQAIPVLLPLQKQPSAWLPERTYQPVG